VITTDKDALFAKVKALVVDQLGVEAEEVTAEASIIEDLGATDLDVINLAMALEEEFEIEIPDEDAEKLLTVGQVVDYIAERAA
jgi:acyl carrier protein